MTDPAVRRFDLTGPLPTRTTLLEASAGTGKTHTIATLAARYIAEGVATIDQLLMITFGRNATRELRERVRETLTATRDALLSPDAPTPTDPVVRLLATTPGAGIAGQRLAAALADFDAATIATTHQFCQQSLAGLGIAADRDPGEQFAEDIRPLVDEVVEDLVVATYSRPRPGLAQLSLAEARHIAHAAVEDPQAELEVGPVTPDSIDDVRVRFARAARTRVLQRRRVRHLVTFDDLVLRLAETLTDPVTGPAACQRLRRRYSVVLVDEFQDTDPAQWTIVETAFHGHRTVILIGDPKQAIYAFRGADVYSYLAAADAADDRATLPTNWRSDGPVVAGIGTLLGSTRLGDDRIVVRPITAARAGSRLSGLPGTARVQLRQLVPPKDDKLPSVRELRTQICADIAAHVVDLLSGDARLTVQHPHRTQLRALVPGDLAVLTATNPQADLVREALARVGVPAVTGGATSVFATEAAGQWRDLLRALESPRGRTIRPAALTDFFGYTGADLAVGGDALDELVAEQLRAWSRVLAERGMAALVAVIAAESGLYARVLSRPDGERTLTDLRHLAGALAAQQRDTHWGATALRDWLELQAQRTAEDGREQTTSRTRRLESDADAVQIITIHRAKGLEFPVTYVPFGWDRFEREVRTVTSHDGDRRVLDVRSPGSDAVRPALAAMREEELGESLRLLYVALTRASSLVVAHWAPSQKNTATSPLHRLLSARGDGEVRPHPRYSVSHTPPTAWLAGSPDVALEVVPATPSTARWTPPSTTRPLLAAAPYDRQVDTTWRRTSYSGLTAGLHGVSGPELAPLDHRQDEPDEDQPLPPDSALRDSDSGWGASASDPGQPSSDRVLGVSGSGLEAPDPARLPRDLADLPSDPERPPVGEPLPSPFATLPAGAAFGTLVHGILEVVDTDAADLPAEVTAQCVDALAQRPFPGVAADVLADALTAALRTPLGPLAAGRCLSDVRRADRLPELDFELPLAGDDAGQTLADVAVLLRRHLPPGDPIRPYADALSAEPLGSAVLRGYLTGSIDAVLRVRDPGPEGVCRHLVVDYKTNLLRDPAEADVERLVRGYRPTVLPAAMIDAHYPLQALLYCAALHRFLRWRQPGYDPEVHLGGVLYLFLRGMAGPSTPTVGAVPCGVFAWKPPAALVTDLSELLDGVPR